MYNTELCKSTPQLELLYGRNFFPNSACSHWLHRGHMTSNNELFPAKIYEPATPQNL